MSCQDIVNFPIVYQKKLVIQGFLRPTDAVFNSDSIIVSIGTNTPVIDTYLDSEINNATVKLKNNETEIILPLLPKGRVDVLNSTRRYGVPAKNLPILPNQNYLLTVTEPDGINEKVECFIPTNKVEENKVKIIVLEKSKNRIRCKVDWEDVKNETNYYNASIVLNLFSKDTRILSGQVIYRNEQAKNSEMLTTNELVFQNLPDYDVNRSFIFVGIANIEEQHYNWGLKLNAQQQQNTSNLFPEPVLVNGNFSKSLGIFSGYNATFVIERL